MTHRALTAALVAIAWIAGCHTSPGTAVRDRPPPPPDAPATASDCADLSFEVLVANWPDPQWIDLGERALFGGGWSSITTGRFGSASWEHCETLSIVGEHVVPLEQLDHPWRSLIVEERSDCRIPDGVLGDGLLFDFHWFRRSLPEHDRETAKKLVGWAPSSHWMDLFGFQSLGLFVDGAWVEAGWPRDGFYADPSHTVLATGDLLLSGGAEDLPDGARRAVAQSAVFRADSRRWEYTAQMHRARVDHAIVAVDDGALAVGGEAVDGAATLAVEKFVARRAQWRVVREVGPPFTRPIAARSGEFIVAVESVERPGEPSRVARIDIDDANWDLLAPAPMTVLAGEANSLLTHPRGDVLLVTPDAVARYQTGNDLWEVCPVSRRLLEEPPRGKGEGRWGPAHVMRDGRVLLTRIDRERYYDFD